MIGQPCTSLTDFCGQIGVHKFGFGSVNEEMRRYTRRRRNAPVVVALTRVAPIARVKLNEAEGNRAVAPREAPVTDHLAEQTAVVGTRQVKPLVHVRLALRMVLTMVVRMDARVRVGACESRSVVSMGRKNKCRVRVLVHTCVGAPRADEKKSHSCVRTCTLT
jgi:hypothetical protein